MFKTVSYLGGRVGNVQPSVVGNSALASRRQVCMGKEIVGYHGTKMPSYTGIVYSKLPASIISGSVSSFVPTCGSKRCCARKHSNLVGVDH